MKKKALIIANPTSGNERAKSGIGEVIEKLDNYFDKIDIKLTKKGKDAVKFAESSEKSGYDSVFGMGGDGTISEIIDGLSRLEKRPKFGIFPFGTANDLARSLNISMNPVEAIENFDINKIKFIDVGKANNRYFSNTLAIGVIPEAVSEVTIEEKTKFGKLAYYFNGFKKFAENKIYKFEMIIDGRRREIETTTIMIALTGTMGGFGNLLPNARVDDNLLHMLYSKDKTQVDTLLSIPELIKGVTESTEKIEYIKFNYAEIKEINGENLVTNIDGDEGVKLPLTVEVLPNHLQAYYG